MKASEHTHDLPPFPAFPCVSRYVPVGTADDALQRVRRSVKSSDGVSLVIGPPGTGKSLLCRILADEFSKTHDVVLLGDAPIDDQADFHRHLLHHLGVDLDSAADGDLHLALIDRVCGKVAAQNGLLIIVDEAQCLSAEVLEAIRMVTNIMRDDQPRVTAVVCGGVKLEDTLAAPALEPFTQRVSTRCYLHPLNSGETRQYIYEAIRACGSIAEDTITDEAIGAIHHVCSGVPRLINQIMTEAIDCAADNDQDYICEKIVDQAWAQLQQLPSPMIEEPKISHQAAPVEFGTLSDLSPVEQPKPANNDPDPCESDPESAEQQPSDLSSQDSGRNAETIQWLDEPLDEDAVFTAPENARQVPVVTPLPAELFGDFEIEESVPVGNGVRSTSTTNHAPPHELEGMIHSEIVSLSEMAADARFNCIEADNQEIVSLGNNPQPVVWLDETDGQPASDEPTVEPDDIVLSTKSDSDDSDLLVIEDDLDVAQPQVIRVDSEDRTIDVDFHAMLNSMRTNK